MRNCVVQKMMPMNRRYQPGTMLDVENRNDEMNENVSAEEVPTPVDAGDQSGSDDECNDADVNDDTEGENDLTTIDAEDMGEVPDNDVGQWCYPTPVH